MIQQNIQLPDPHIDFSTDRRDQVLRAQKTLRSLGYRSTKMPKGLWERLVEATSDTDSIFGYLNPSKGEEPAEQVLRHQLRFANGALADAFVAALAKHHPHFKLHSIRQPCESLEDREVELTSVTCMTSKEVTRASCQVLETAHPFLGDEYQWRREAAAEAFAAIPQTIRFDAWPSRPKRTFRLRLEAPADALIVRFLLMPWVCRWTEVCAMSLDRQGAQTSTPSLFGMEAEFETADDQMTLDQMRWLLSRVPDLHVAAESLAYAHDYTGERIHFDYLRRITPSQDALLGLRKAVARLMSFKDYDTRRFMELCEGLNLHEFPEEEDEPLEVAQFDDDEDWEGEPLNLSRGANGERTVTA